MLETNLIACMNFVKKRNPKTSLGNCVLGIKTEEDLFLLLSIIPSQSKRVFMARWGLDGSKQCFSYVELNKKLGISNAKTLYTESIRHLSMAKDILLPEGLMFNKIDEDFEICVKYALFRRKVMGKNITSFDGSAKEFGENFSQLLDTLLPREKEIIKTKYLSKNKTVLTLVEIAQNFEISCERVRQIEVDAYRKLRNHSRRKLLCSSKTSTIQMPKEYYYEDPTQIPLEALDLCTRTLNLLTKNGYYLVGHLTSSTDQDLMQITQFGKKSLEEVHFLLNSLGVKNKEETAPICTDFDNLLIVELNLSIRSTNCLLRAGYVTVKDIKFLSDEEFLKLHYFGITCLKEVKAKLKSLGLR